MTSLFEKVVPCACHVWQTTKKLSSRARVAGPGELTRSSRIPLAPGIGSVGGRRCSSSPRPSTNGQPPPPSHRPASADDVARGHTRCACHCRGPSGRMSRCSSSTTVEIVQGGSCPSRPPSPSVCIMSSAEPRPPSPSLCIVSETRRAPSPSVCIVREEPRAPSFCVVSGRRSASPTTVYVVSEGEQQPRRPARSPNVCIVTTSPRPQTPDVCIVTEERPPSPSVCVVTETRRSPSPTRVEVIEAPKRSSSTIIIEE
ncbi:uncharacterized protein LOC142567984 [Dermacentor variabilis]|uniref:uncharacterized protein LOC142567984 n=1 Tax=Dermacentor variabilis TaxID=34621 RepID=UPI003F5C3B24